MNNQNTITTTKHFFSLEKELAYINEMNEKGWKLVYIKLGIRYTFVKTEPGEYITLLHTETKERLSAVTAFAAQCGYEAVPHSNDGFGELIYLTGKKSEVSPDFVISTADKLDSKRRIYKKFRILTWIYHILTLLLILETAFISITNAFSDETYVLAIVFNIIVAVFTLIVLVMDIRIVQITHKMKRDIKELEKEMSIYE